MTREEQIAYLTEWLEEKVLFSGKDREVLTAAKQALEEQGRVLELIDTVAKRHCHDYEEIEYQEGYEQAIIEIKEAVEDCDLEERKKGKWERHYIRPGVYADLWFHATCCGSVMSFVTDYCPYCGAKMIRDGDTND